MKIRAVISTGVLVATVVFMVAAPARTGAAGITTHQWMARTAVGHVVDPQLANLLSAHIDMVNTGAGFPDVGYVGANTYGETAHWQRFVDNLVGAIRARPDCPVPADPHGPCADLIAFTFGVAAHGMGDEVWDWLFEPNSADRDEYWTGVPTAGTGGAETQMDIVAIGRYGVGRTVARSVPDIPLVLRAFTDSGTSGVTASQFDLVLRLPELWDVEKGWADDHLGDVEAAMPWMAEHLVTAPGGVDFAARAIAGYWSSQWGRLLGNQPATRVSITYPAPGQTDVPVTGWDRATFEPGSHPGRGGARNRIAAVLTSARPYTGSGGGTVSDLLPDGSMTITDVGSGLAVPLKSGYPRSVPYGSDSGEHTIDVQPAANLDACRWYRVDVGVDASLDDARGASVTPYSWQFRTVCAAEPGPPSTTVQVTSSTVPLSSSSTPAPMVDRPRSEQLTTLMPAAPAHPVAAVPTFTG